MAWWTGNEPEIVAALAGGSATETGRAAGAGISKAYTGPETEGHFQAAVIDLARSRGWKVAHFRKARTKKGWRTAVAADGKGFPDLVMVRAGRIIFAELKTKDGTPTKEQAAWLAALGELVPCCVHCRVQVHLWRPGDWPEIDRALA